MSQGLDACQPDVCRASLTVRDKPVTWASRERFGPNAIIQVVMRVGRRALDYEQVDQCQLRFYGAGLAVKVSVCRPRMRLRAVSVDGLPRLRILYTVLD